MRRHLLLLFHKGLQVESQRCQEAVCSALRARFIVLFAVQLCYFFYEPPFVGIRFNSLLNSPLNLRENLGLKSESPATIAAIDLVRTRILVCGGSNSTSPAVSILSEAPIIQSDSLIAATQTVTRTFPPGRPT